MRALSATELMSAWERGRSQTVLQRALTLLASAWTDASPDQLAQLSLGQRDGQLLTLREWAFGSQLKGVAACPACSEKLEVEFDVSDIRVAAAPSLAEEFSIATKGYEIRCRLPNSADLFCLRADEEISANELRLLERCMLSARSNGSEVTVDQLPKEVINAVAKRMAEADPQADVELALNCPACAHRWTAPFDIVSFFWTEINAWALRMLREVHLLASAYGWSEKEILSLSPCRRQAYLEMIGA